MGIYFRILFVANFFISLGFAMADPFFPFGFHPASIIAAGGVR